MTKKVTLLHHIFENQAKNTPNALAVKSNGVEFTYKDIDEKANQLANYLIVKGVKTNDLIGIYFKRSELPVIAMLGVLKAGAGYIPIDRSFPKDRVSHIVNDASVYLVLTEMELIEELSEKTSISFLDISSPKINTMLSDRSYEEAIKTQPEDLCYIIYTSGSTGKPKGVMTQHQNVVHFVGAFKKVCGLKPSDRLYNGFAYSFDGSVEEIWMAFSSGASLIVVPDEVTKLASEAAKLIRDESITFLSTVPTFLTMINEPLESLRLIILSGEVCPPELINKWVSPNVRLLNVYGPTEATVNTTFWECKKDKVVTIGKAIPDYDTFILNEHLLPVAKGEKGELYIGGNGLAKGYLNRADLTAKTFIENALNGQRLYKTGDLVSLNEEEDLVFHGRLDSQIKIRGYRVELSEIEMILSKYPNVSNAVVSVVDNNGIKELAAYVELKDFNKKLDVIKVLAYLKKDLPVYMLPTYLEEVEEFPRLTSGKINRKQLPIAQTLLIKRDRVIIKPEGNVENILVNVWGTIFGMSEISIEDNFFNDLLGHSLLAAKAVSLLRSEYGLDVAIKDIYTCPTIKILAVSISNNNSELEENVSTITPVKKAPKRKLSKGVSFLQALSIYPLYLVVLTPVVFSIYFLFQIYSLAILMPYKVAISFGLLFVTYPLFVLFGVGLKWLVIGEIKQGSYPLSSFYYYRWWLADRVQALTIPSLLAGSPLMPLYYRLMGAKVGANCSIDTHLSSAWDLLSIGDNSTICNETQLSGVIVENGYLRIGKIAIGTNCYVGIHSYLGLNTKMENNSRLGDLSALQENEVIKENVTKQGSPAINIDVIVPKGKVYKGKPILWGFLHGIGIVGIELFLMAAGIPVFALLYYSLIDGSFLLKVLSILVAGPLGVLSFCLLTAILKRIIFHSVAPGIYKTESFFYLRKWFVDCILRLSVTLVKPVYTTIFFPKWLRLLGAKVGKMAEISTVSQFSPELMDIGDESFFADGSIIGGRKFYKGYMEISKTTIGKRSFIGNSAILPVGTSIGDNCLIGVLSVPPIKKGTIKNNTDWLGSPSFNLPHRQKVEGFDEKTLFKPSLKLYALRYLIDSLRIWIPSTIQVLSFLSVSYYLYFSYINNYKLITVFAWFPIVTLVTAITSVLIAVLVKWILVGKIKPTTKPLWCTFVWFNEAVNGTYETIIAPTLSMFLGTPFLRPFLRLMGCKIGKNVYLNTTLFSEFDLVSIEDNVTINSGVVIQNHLFEDRIFKASSLIIKENSTIGNMSIVLYDTVINENTDLKPLSLVMKNETLPANSNWNGIPCARQKNSIQNIKKQIVNANYVVDNMPLRVVK